MIHEMLSDGPANAISSTHLARVLGVTRRDISRMVEKERRAGRPICATCNQQNPGYYLPRTLKDLAIYINRIRSREAEIAKTRKALENILREGLKKGRI